MEISVYGYILMGIVLTFIGVMWFTMLKNTVGKVAFITIVVAQIMALVLYSKGIILKGDFAIFTLTSFAIQSVNGCVNGRDAIWDD